MTMTRRSLAVLSLVLLATLAGNAAPLDPSGYFFLVKPTSVCQRFDHLMLDYSHHRWNGWIQLNTQQRYDLRAVTLSGTTFRFRTATDDNGVSYAFNGHFLHGGQFSQMQPKGTVLVGRLTVTRGDRATMAADVRFTYSVGD